MEDLGQLNLRQICQIGEFNQTHMRDAACSFLPELRVIAQSCAYRGGHIFAEGSRILIADHRQNRHFEVTKR